MSTSVSQYGITWTWVEDLTVGQYANGDYYVVAPSGITITGITPASTLVSGRTKNGSMVNPTAGTAVQQGFDSFAASFSASLNRARPGGNDLSVGNPLILAAGSSLISSISFDANVRPQLQTAAVLTIVAAAPSAGAMRPPYCGTDKTHSWNKNSMDYSWLRKLIPPQSTPTISSISSQLQRPWIEIITEYTGRDIHPSLNQPDYGQVMSNVTGDAWCLLNLNYSNEQKETLLIYLCQYGIDVYGAALTGGNWINNGGHNIGRKGPLIVAAKTFGNAGMLEYADADQHFIFQEDQQTFVVDAAEEAIVPTIADGRPRVPYAPKSATITFTGGAITYVNWANNLLAEDQLIRFNGGTLPTNLIPDTEYFVVAEVMPATSLIANQYATIEFVGTTNWHSIGVPAGLTPAYGVFFKATGAGTGNGSVRAVNQTSFPIAAKYNETSITTIGNGSGTITGQMNLLGYPEWGEKHWTQKTRDASNWNVLYRELVYGPNAGHALSAILTSTNDEWNWDPFFDYQDRVMGLIGGPPGYMTWFQWYMWQTYRNATAAPSAPTGASATATGVSTTQVTWTDTTGGAASFIIERSLNNANTWVQAGTTAAGVTTFNDGGLQGNLTYDYRIFSLTTTGGESNDPSNTASVTTDTPAPFVSTGPIPSTITNAVMTTP